MAAPNFVEEKPLALIDVKDILDKIEQRDAELNYLSNKAKEYLAAFVTLTPENKEKMNKKLVDLNLTRLKEEHICKIIDFLPVTINELKAVLQAYPLSLPKKDQEEIIKCVKDFAG